MLTSRIERVLDTARVVYSGDTTDLPYGPLTEVAELTEKGVKKLLLDFKDVDYLNSAGISTLLATDKLVHDNGGSIAIFNLQPQVEKVIRLTKMNTLLSCFDEEIDAARHVGMITGDTTLTKREEIIVVEKDIPITRSLKNVFEEFRHLLMYQVVPTEGLDDASNHLSSSNNAGLIVLDVNFEPLHTVEFLEKMKMNQEFRHVPIIIVTKDENISHAHYLIRNGADDMLRFPFNKYEASARLRFCLFYQQEIRNLTT